MMKNRLEKNVGFFALSLISLLIGISTGFFFYGPLGNNNIYGALDRMQGSLIGLMIGVIMAILIYLAYHNDKKSSKTILIVHLISGLLAVLIILPALISWDITIILFFINAIILFYILQKKFHKVLKLSILRFFFNDSMANFNCFQFYYLYFQYSLGKIV